MTDVAILIPRWMRFDNQIMNSNCAAFRYIRHAVL